MMLKVVTKHGVEVAVKTTDFGFVLFKEDQPVDVAEVDVVLAMNKSGEGGMAVALTWDEAEHLHQYLGRALDTR